MGIERVWILTVAATAFLLSGCLSAPPVGDSVHFYILEYDPPPIAPGEPLPYTIRIAGLKVAPTYESRLIVYREGEYKRDAYVYHKWRDRPGEMVLHLLLRDFRQSNLFQAVLGPDSRLPASYLLEGSLEAFYELDQPQGWYAVLELDMVLAAETEEPGAGHILFQRHYGAREPCHAKHPRALAEAMSRALSSVSAAIIKDVHERLKTP